MPMVKELSFCLSGISTALLKTLESELPFRVGRTPTHLLLYVDDNILTGSTHDEDYPCHPG